LGPDSGGDPQARRRVVLRPALRHGVRLPQRRAVVLRGANCSGTVQPPPERERECQ
jgi:hypothetical protein